MNDNPNSSVPRESVTLYFRELEERKLAEEARDALERLKKARPSISAETIRRVGEALNDPSSKLLDDTLLKIQQRLDSESNS